MPLRYPIEEYLRGIQAQQQRRAARGPAWAEAIGQALTGGIGGYQQAQQLGLKREELGIKRAAIGKAETKRFLDLANKAEDNARQMYQIERKNISYPYTDVGKKEAFIRRGLSRIEAYKSQGIKLPKKESDELIKRINTANMYLRNARGRKIIIKDETGTKTGTDTYQYPADLTERIEIFRRTVTSGTIPSEKMLASEFDRLINQGKTEEQAYGILRQKYGVKK